MITKEPENRRNNTKDFFLTRSARSSFSSLLKHIYANTTKSILLPSYIGETDSEGSGVFDPIRENNVRYEFYSIKKDLSADFSEISAYLKSGKFKTLLVIHYFGFVQNNMEELSSLCIRNNVILIEDCAHSFFSKYKKKNIGEWGDLSFFSIHKILPTPDGGYFRVNNKDIGIPEPGIEDQDIMPVTLDQFIRTDYEKVNNIRRSNYQKYLNGFIDMHGLRPLYNKLPKSIIPLNFPIIIENGLREKLYFKLIDKGIITCSLYYRLIKEINKNIFPISYEISSKILNLPVHQDTRFIDIDEIIFKIKESLDEIKYENIFC